MLKYFYLRNLDLCCKKYSICMIYSRIGMFYVFSLKKKTNWLLFLLLSKIQELSYFSLLDAAILPTATKPKTLQTEEPSTTGSNHNVTANTSQDREFIPFENERIYSIGVMRMLTIALLRILYIC